MSRALALAPAPPAPAPDADPRVARWSMNRWAKGAAVGAPFRCPLNGHDGDARIDRRPGGGGWAVVCSCDGSQEWLAPPAIWAAEKWAGRSVSRGDVFRLSPYQRRIWRLRLLHDLGIAPVPLPPVTQPTSGLTPNRQRVLDGLVLLTGLVSAHDTDPDADGAEPYSARFAEAWTDVPKSTAWRALEDLVGLGVISRGKPLALKVGTNRPTNTFVLPAPTPVDLATRRAPTPTAIEQRAPSKRLWRIARYVVPRLRETPADRHRRPTGTDLAAAREWGKRLVEGAVDWSCESCGSLGWWYHEDRRRVPVDPDAGVRCLSCDPPPTTVMGEGSGQ